MTIQLVTSDRFKMLHRQKRADAPLVGVRKMQTGEVVKLDDRTLRFTISTAAVDRDMDTIAVAGWELANFERNPVVLWSHNAEMLPIGKAIDVMRNDDRLMSAVRFLPEEGYGTASLFADTVYRMAADGWINATSVGFRPLSWDFTEDETRGGDSWWPGIDFHTQELVELSIVSVPANPEALIEPQMVEQTSTPEPETATAAHERRARRRRAMIAAMLGVRSARPHA